MEITSKKTGKSKILLRTNLENALPTLVLVLFGIAVTLVCLFYLRDHSRTKLKSEFQTLKDQVPGIILGRFTRIEQTLYGVRGLHNNSNRVEPAEFLTARQALNNESLAGLKKFDFLSINEFEKMDASLKVRLQGAAEKSARSSKACISNLNDIEKLDSSEIPSFLLVPIYDKRLPLLNPQARREAIFGWVLAELDLREITHISFGSRENQFTTDLVPVGALSAGGSLPINVESSEYTSTVVLEIGGESVHLRISPTKHFLLSRKSPFSGIFGTLGILLIGFLCTLFLGLNFNSWLKSSRKRKEKWLRLESDLVKLELKWKQAFEITGDGIWESNGLENKLYLSNESRVILGLNESSPELFPRDWLARIHPSDLERVEQALDEHFQGINEIYECEYRFKRMDSTYQWVLARGKVIEWIKPCLPAVFIGTIRNIESLMSQKLEVQKITELHAAIIKHSIHAIITVDATGLITSFNPAAESILGYSAEEVIGKKTPALWHNPQLVKDYAEEVSKEFGVEVKPGFSVFAFKADRNIPNEREWPCTRKDGKIVILRLSLTALRDKNGAISGYLGIAIDNTEKHETAKIMAEQAIERTQMLVELQNEKFAMDQHSIVATTDISGTITYVNEKFCLVSQYSPEELIGQNHRILNSGYHSREFFLDLYQTIHSGKVWHGEIQNKAKDGTFYWVNTTIVPMKNSNGEIQEFIAIRTEITDQKKNEAELKQRQYILEATNESYPGILIASVDLNYNYLNFNSLTQKTVFGLFGTHLIIGSNMLNSITDAKLRSEVKADLDRAFSGESHDRIIITGENAWHTRFNPLFNELGDVFGATYFTEDISRIKAKEIEQAKTVQRLKLACSAGRIGIWEYDILNSTLNWDDQMFALYGINRQTFTGTYEAWRNGLHPEDIVKSELDLSLAIEGHIEFNTEFRVIWPDGSVHHIRALAKVLKNEAGIAASMIGTNWDITDRKNAEFQIRNAVQAAEASNRAKTEFLSNMSHELRTPLNSVIGFSNILLKNKPGNLSEQDLSYLNRIASNGKHLLELINSVLDLSKIEAGHMEMESLDFDLVKLAREILLQFEPQAKESGLTLVLHAPELIKPLRSDILKFKQVLINLVGNALKFTKEGSIAIRILTSSDDQMPFAVEVVDTGIGIPKERLTKIFEAFQQADNSISRRFGGTGLGLTISRSLITQMGFHLDVASIPGEGSTFTIYLRTLKFSNSALDAKTILPENPVLIPNTTEIFSHKLLNARVLIIDDEPDSRYFLRNYLEEFGCIVEEAISGEDSLEKARIFMPDLITLDLVMPQENGWSIALKLKSDEKLKSIPIVVVSILAGDINAGLMGIVGAIEKPISRESLFLNLKKGLSANEV